MERYTAQTRAYLAFTALAIFAGALGCVFMWGDNTLQSVMVGAAIFMAKETMGFYTQTSASSARKDQTIADGQAALAVSTPPNQGQP